MRSCYFALLCLVSACVSPSARNDGLEPGRERTAISTPQCAVPTGQGPFNLTLGAREFEDSRWQPLAETFDVGIDTGTKVTKLCTGTFPFRGEADKVVTTLTQ